MAAPRLLAAFLLALAAARPAAADVIVFSNLGPGGSWNQENATFFGFDFDPETPGAESNFSRAFPFVPSATGTLRVLQLPVAFPFSFDQGSLVVNVFASEGGMPGQLLERFERTEPHRDPSLLTFESSAAPLLRQGETYFVEAATIGEGDGLWFLSLGEPPGRQPDVFRFGLDEPFRLGVRDFTSAAFRVSADPAPIPEPATLLLAGAGLLEAGRRAREARRRSASRRR
jgi:hypothetical protein